MAYEAELMTGFLVKKDFSIDEESIIYDETQMMCAEITGFAYGATETRVSGIKANTEYRFEFVDSSEDRIKFTFVNALLGSPNPLDADQRITEEIWKCFGNRILQETISKISLGMAVEINKVMFSRYGITIPHRPLFGSNSDFLVPWEDMECEVEMGQVTLFTQTERKARAVFTLNMDINAHIVLELFYEIGRNSELISKLTGRKKN
ncbi:MAG TPA: hypothetical protein VK826_20235 [Bacteroidia bacterium]|nr:hypothetical protein [Bacteroidia bacterium]